MYYSPFCPHSTELSTFIKHLIRNKIRSLSNSWILHYLRCTYVCIFRWLGNCRLCLCNVSTLCHSSFSYCHIGFATFGMRNRLQRLRLLSVFITLYLRWIYNCVFSDCRRTYGNMYQVSSGLQHTCTKTHMYISIHVHMYMYKARLTFVLFSVVLVFGFTCTLYLRLLIMLFACF